nr:hypothetical protein [Tanacetum cinerariifolium]
KIKILNCGEVLERVIKKGEDEELPLFAFGSFDFQAYYYSGLYSNQGLGPAWRGGRMPKVTDLAATPNGENLISVFLDRDIRILNVDINTKRVISEQHRITSLFVSDDNKYLIVNLNSQEIHMWDVEGSWEKSLRYKGYRQEQYVIRYVFGGVNGIIIASGIENFQV